MGNSLVIPDNKFRKKSVRERRTWLASLSGSHGETGKPGTRSDLSYSGTDQDLLDLADVMIENAVGYLGIPLGIAYPLQIDGREYAVPMAVEEPSVVAAASYAGALTGRHGGLTTHASDPVMTTQIFVEEVDEDSLEKVRHHEETLKGALDDLLQSMRKRGGGWRGMDCRWIAPSRTLAVNIRVDVRDAMGANLLNSAAETLRPVLESLTGGSVLMAILTNRSWDRTAGARCRIPVDALGRPGYPGDETARRIVKASRIAREDPDRGVTHNKGIMNGISALALATGNDTRAIEAAAHAWAGRYGPYHALSEFWLEGEYLYGALEMPLPFAVTGGAVGYHPISRWSLELLGNPDAPGLSRIAAAVGLAQNLAALRSLVSEGIQAGHMPLHARRLSWDAGARAEELVPFAVLIREEGINDRDKASRRLETWRRERDGVG